MHVLVAYRLPHASSVYLYFFPRLLYIGDEMVAFSTAVLVTR